MAKFIKIQPSLFCENCIACGSRPVIEQGKGSKFIVRCPKDSTHYQTEPGLINIEDWNRNNKVKDEGAGLRAVAN